MYIILVVYVASFSIDISYPISIGGDSLNIYHCIVYEDKNISIVFNNIIDWYILSAPPGADWCVGEISQVGGF